jgi:hypothetical protein
MEQLLKERRYIAYADYVLILRQSVREIEEVVIQSKEAAVSTGLVTNESKEKYMEIKTHTTNLEHDLIINGQALEGVQNSRYSGVLTNYIVQKYLGLEP